MVRHKAPGSTSKKGGVEESTRVSKDKPVAFQALQGSEYKYSTAHQIRVVTYLKLTLFFVVGLPSALPTSQCGQATELTSNSCKAFVPNMPHLTEIRLVSILHNGSFVTSNHQL